MDPTGLKREVNQDSKGRALSNHCELLAKIEELQVEKMKHIYPLKRSKQSPVVGFAPKPKSQSGRLKQGRLQARLRQLFYKEFMG